MANKTNGINGDTLIALAAVIQEQSDIKDVFALIIKHVNEFFTTDHVFLSMVNPRTMSEIKTLISEGKFKNQETCQKVQFNITKWIMHHQKPFYTQNLIEDTRFKKSVLKDAGIQSVIGVPLKWEGLIIGALVFITGQETSGFNQADFREAQKIATLVSPYLYNIEQIERFFSSSSQEEILLTKYQKFGLIGKSQKFIELLHATEAAARCDVRVLLQGETGTGKEVVAKAIHKNSSRAKHRFVAIDCGAIPTELLESELFGHIAGAYTGANYNQKGLLEIADKGTLFMDEISNLPLPMQSKLLRVLQANEIRPLGSAEIHKIDVRIVAASSDSLWDLVNTGRFREDLFYRLHVFPIQVPTLRQRHDDIPRLAEYFLQRFTTEQQKNIIALHPKVIEFMLNYHWKGNIRELENFIERLVTLTPPERDLIDFGLIPEGFLHRARQNNRENEAQESLVARMHDIEKRILEQTLTKQDWNQSAAARVLKISESSIRYKMKKFGIDNKN